mgnify:CR=1 FL=1
MCFSKRGIAVITVAAFKGLIVGNFYAKLEVLELCKAQFGP